MVSKLVFFSSLGILAYIYAGYPLLLLLTSLFFRKKRKPSLESLPTISLIIPAHNEEACIEKKLKNALEIDYPPEKLEIIVASDASTDRTVEKARGLGARIKVFDFKERAGKMGVINKSVPKAAGEILALTDANAQFASYTLKELAKFFADPSVGCVSGAKVIRNLTADIETDRGESEYWKYESLLKYAETLTGSCVGADGSVYALRKSLYSFPKSGRIIMDDFAVSLMVVKQGYGCIFEPAARAFEESARKVEDEFRRKGRIFAGALSCLLYNPGLLFSPLFFKLVSHKILRWMTCLFQITLFAASYRLSSDPLFRPLFGAQVVFYACALAGWILSRFSVRIVAFHIPYYFNMTTFAQGYGLWYFLKRGWNPAWEKVR